RGGLRKRSAVTARCRQHRLQRGCIWGHHQHVVHPRQIGWVARARGKRLNGTRRQRKRWAIEGLGCLPSDRGIAQRAAMRRRKLGHKGVRRGLIWRAEQEGPLRATARIRREGSDGGWLL